MPKIFVGFSFKGPDFVFDKEDNQLLFNDSVEVEVSQTTLEEMEELEESAAKLWIMCRNLYKENGGDVDV